ncbi:serine hydrolase [Spongiivirga sp. MCCC 1A20706]|uniref:serine hydrolase n=1 Tax=Spongiivirga sp. MCCC 1A20706 TaxID=3160963 RepID=UPI0039777030
MSKSISVLFLFSLSFIFSIEAQNNHQKQIDSVLDICYKRGIFNGNALVIKDAKVIYSTQKGFTDGSKTIPLADNSMFNIGSIAKEFNAVGIMMLKEKGLLNLEDKISKYQLGLPAWSNKITIKHLLQYTSGLPSIDWENVHNADEVYNNLKQLKALAFEPGTGYLYSNNNVFLQRRIIEKVTGKTFNRFLQEDILQPVGMNNSVIDHQYENPDFVIGFNSKGINDEKKPMVFSGWVCPSINDFAKWVNQLMSYQLVSKESVYQLFEAYSKESQSALGNGMFTDGELTSYYHHGSSRSYEAIVYYDLENDILAILMTNSKGLKIGEIAEAIIHVAKDEDFTIPHKSIYLTIREKTYENVDQGIALYHDLKKNDFNTYNFSDQWELARLAYKLFEKKQSDHAMQILRLLVAEIPKKSEEAISYLAARILAENQVQDAILINQLLSDKFPSGKTHGNLGDVYYNNKQFTKALSHYQKSIALQPDNIHSQERIIEIKSMK